MAEDWRAQLAGRLRAHRQRQLRLQGGNGQPELEFSPAGLQTAVQDMPEAAPPPPLVRARAPRPRRAGVERMEINIEQPSLRFEDPEDQGLPAQPSSLRLPLPLAPLSQRIRAGLIDAGLVVFAYGAVLALFTALGGQLTYSRMDMAVVAATFALFCAQYLLLFMFLGGATPGMMLRGLAVVTLEGTAPDTPHLLRRIFGYMISAGPAMLGFVWAAWDEEHLAWHDRLSQTYLTQVDVRLRVAQSTAAAPSAHR
jgi:uncharacterized RDD family membrane protein YckC